jgi:hypothetical protein
VQNGAKGGTMWELFSERRLAERGVRVGEFPRASFKYGQLEEAIAAMHNLHPSGMKTFKSRVKHFQRIGLVSSSPGRGYKKLYSVIDAVAWALCFEFAELSVPPETIRNIMVYCEERLFNAFIDKFDDDIVFFMKANFFEQHINLIGESSVEGTERLFNFTPDQYGIGSPNFVFGRLKYPPIVSRMLLLNLTHIKTKLGETLKISWP